MQNKRIIFGLLYSENFFHLSRNFRLQRVGSIEWLKDNYELNRTYQFIDELVFFLVSRSYDQKEKMKFFDNINNLRKQLFCPIMIGGGIKNFDDARICFENGADKIFISTEFTNFELINRISDVYGNQSISVVLDYKKINNNFEIYTNCGRTKVSSDLETVFLKLQKENIGEIILHSIDRDGTGNGYDLKIFDEIDLKSKKPLILMGGAGQPNHIVNALDNSKVSGVITANLFNFIGNTLETTRELCLKKNLNIANLI